MIEHYKIQIMIFLFIGFIKPTLGQQYSTIMADEVDRGGKGHSVKEQA